MSTFVHKSRLKSPSALMAACQPYCATPMTARSAPPRPQMSCSHSLCHQRHGKAEHKSLAAHLRGLAIRCNS
ncbi:hypothetical protein K458DRAFT_194181 [Lentithecium fluviatile CBS 122367]|uniref:Uncharacterized protein n=1 Tax=Lentithecium fluviatile CBS 122367 TaxID=1168545 RepID=A0A6G1IDE1_9PLEO|nr:hypothetical protein K458DRAFT_194181 [Lentithecium fluviatile CBS 122367]